MSDETPQDPAGAPAEDSTTLGTPGGSRELMPGDPIPIDPSVWLPGDPTEGPQVVTEPSEPPTRG